VPVVFKATGLTKNFEELAVLSGVAFTLGQSESLALLGPSGCGKTTLLRILLGLESADAGDFSHILNRAGYLPQGSLLLPWKRVIENIELPLLLKGMGQQERRARIREQLPIFGLEGFETSYPFELSGGMRQRVALLRAVMAGAQPLILDEPFGALDTVTRHRLQDWLRDVVDQLGSSMIFVTHDLEEAVALSHRILVLSERPASVLGQLCPELTAQERRNRMSPNFLKARNALVDLIVSQETHD